MASTVPESQQSHQPAVAAEEQQAAAAAAAGAVPAAQTGKFSTSSLWVGDLAPEVAETDLYEAFVSIGPIASFRLLRDAITRRSLEYAYVNYANSLDAERAIEALNFVELKGKPIRIMWSQRDPAVRRSGLGNIFIKNLHPDIDNKALYDTFSVFGNILSCKVATDEHGKSKGYGYVHFETQDAAEMTIKTVNGMLLNGQKVEVERFVPRRERSSGDGSEVKFNNVFVKNLPDSLTEEKLRELFSQFGEITSAMIRRDDSTGSSKMFGFVTFADRAAAKAAVDALNGKPVDGKEIYVGRAMKKAERTAILRREYEAMKMDRLTKMQGVNLYIKNLDESIDDEKLRRLFEEFGSITSCKVMTDDKGVSRGFGFVCFTTADEATRAVTQMNVHMVGSKPLYVSLAQKKEFRQAQLAAQYAQRMPAMPYGPRAIPMGVPPGPGFPPGQMFFPPGPRQPFMYPQAVARGFPPGAFPPGYAPGMPYGAMPINRRGPPGPGARAGPGGQKPTGPRGPRAMGPGGAPVAGQQPRGPVGAVPGAGMPSGPGAAGRGPRGPQQAPAGAAVPAGQAMVDPATLAGLNPAEQKRYLGDALFPRVQTFRPQDAAKITGMLIEMDNSEILNLLESPDELETAVKEAAALYEDHMKRSAPAPATAGNA